MQLTKAPSVNKSGHQNEHKLFESHMYFHQVPPRFELGSLDSESRVLTITPWDPTQIM